MRELTLRYDPAAQAVYIYVGDTEFREADRTIEVGKDGDVMADLDKDGHCFGVEILGVAAPVVHVYDTGDG